MLAGRIFFSLDPDKMHIWASLHQGGSMHPRHIHYGAVVSGVFYVSAPYGAGPICFYDARGSVPPFDREIRHVPETGDLFLFPPWLGHAVMPSARFAGPRISISFNYVDTELEGGRFNWGEKTAQLGAVPIEDYQYSELSPDLDEEHIVRPVEEDADTVDGLNVVRTVGAGEALDGIWADDDGTTVVIDGGKIRGPDGITLDLKMKSAGEISLCMGDEVSHGKLLKDGRIAWSDGAFWVRQEIAGPGDPSIETDKPREVHHRLAQIKSDLSSEDFHAAIQASSSSKHKTRELRSLLSGILEEGSNLLQQL
mmetsp:Transcript_83959/g.146116  ORF Transcript_83959/g.146116 Transcript_83959/m.146116 type:complete len:310 (-) Transcript_83959:63-992(-)